MRSIMWSRRIITALLFAVAAALIVIALAGSPPCRDPANLVGTLSFDPQDKTMQRISKYVESDSIEAYRCADGTVQWYAAK